MLFSIRTNLRRLVKSWLFAINAIWAIPAVVLIRTVRFWVRVRIGRIDYLRIGGFVLGSSIFLARSSLQLQNERTIDLFWLPKWTCNEQWARMVRRQLLVRWWVRYVMFFNRIIPGGAVHDLGCPTSTAEWGIYSILRQSTTRFEFTFEEEVAAKAWLRSRGWQDGELFVCLAVRDSAYLSSSPLHARDNREFWSYHNYRDSDIDTYVESVQALIDKGYWVIRVGKIAHKRLSLRHPRVIDYPFVDDQDDLMDIWLGANCRFCISTGTGIDTIPTVYGRHGTVVNLLPLKTVFSAVNQLTVPKKLRWKDSGRLLTLTEHCNNGYYRTKDYEQAGIAIEDLLPAEITAAVLESEQRVAGTWVETVEDRTRQRHFWAVFRNWRDFHNVHGNIHPEARVGCAWLKSMGDAFLE